jgi:Na+/H+-dicarboxylate symporter
MPRHFTLYILAGMVLGLIAGQVCNASIHDPAAIKDAAGYFSLLTDIFLRMIKMIIAPLVFSTLTAGIAHMGDGKAVGRVGGKTIGLFIIASLISLLIGMLMVDALHPGSGLNLKIDAVQGAAPATGGLSLKDFVEHVFPASVADAMAKNEILQIVVFSIFAGTAMGALGERTAGLLALIEQLAALMLKITNAVMLFAPVAVFAAIAAAITTQGLGILKTYALFVGDFYLALLILWAVMALAGLLVLGPRIRGLMRAVREPVLLAFSTATSEAAYPRTLENLELFGVSKRVASFVLPLGYSFNLVGSMMYCTFATLFIAQAYGISLTLGQKITMLLILMVTSKGIAGVPRASIVVVSATLAAFRLPEAGLLLILAVDHFLDMGRSATNVFGNSVASGIVANWEGELGPPRPLDALIPATAP